MQGSSEGRSFSCRTWAQTRYWPAGSCVNWNAPSGPEDVRRAKEPETAITTAATAAPLSSRTVPTMLPLLEVVWATMTGTKALNFAYDVVRRFRASPLPNWFNRLFVAMDTIQQVWP